MAVTTGTWFLQTTGDGSTTTFLCAFPVMRLDDIKVYVGGVLQTAERDYSITGAVQNNRNSIDAGWSVVFTDAPANEAVVYIRRQTPRHNSNKLYKGDKFSLPVFENNYDNLTMMYQELGGLIIDGFQGPIPENISPQQFYPEYSGFYPAKIVDGPTSSQYVIRSVSPTPEGGWNTVSFPILDETAADLNGRTDYSLNDIVLAKPFADSAGNVAWRFVGNEDCASTAEPPYGGTYLEVARCDNLTVDEVAWVRSDEFNTGDSFVRYGVCYSVLSTGTPGLNSLVIRASEVTTYSNCTNCTTANPSSPDTETPPFPPSRYLRMARCEDDSLGEYSIPMEYFGIPTNHDLTKVYKLNCICYYVTNIEEATPSDPLFPVHTADVLDNCDTCSTPECPYVSTDEGEATLAIKSFNLPASLTATEYGVGAGLALWGRDEWNATWGGTIQEAFEITEINPVTRSTPCLWASGDVHQGNNQIYYASGGGDAAISSISVLASIGFGATPTEGNPRWYVLVPVYPKATGSGRLMAFVKESGCGPAGVYVADTQILGVGESGYLSGGSLVVE